MVTQGSRTVVLMGVVAALSVGCGPGAGEEQSPGEELDVIQAEIKGCSTGVYDYADTISRDVFFGIPSPDFPLYMHYVDVRLTTTVVYWWCRNGQNPDKIKPKNISATWTYLQKDTHLFFEGVMFSGRIWDNSSARDIDIPPIWVPDDGTMQNTVVYNIPSDGSAAPEGYEERWMLRSERPKWNMIGKFVLNNLPDHSWSLSEPASYQYLEPSNDVQVGGYHD
jgi:hypothetical protein